MSKKIYQKLMKFVYSVHKGIACGQFSSQYYLPLSERWMWRGRTRPKFCKT